jgi:2-methylcitrate dehydratase PrpD
MPTLSQELIEWTWSLAPNAVPEGVRQVVCDHALDGIGTAMAASRLGEALYVNELMSKLGGSPESSVIGSDKTGAATAAFANGILIHALDFDDTHPEALVHPTAVVIPAALAVGESLGASGREVLTAAVAGYEVVIRLGAAVRHGFHARGFHATSVCGVFSSAMVAARLMGLRESQAVNALGIAGSFASGSLEFLRDGTATKQLHPGWASHGGIVAAYLAAAGATGPATILEGEAGLFQLFARTKPDGASISADLGRVWHLSDTMIKPYPACQLSHASVDALKSVRHRIGDLRTIDKIIFEVPADSIPIVCEPLESKLRPRTAYEAKFSLQWCAAAFLVDGALTVETFEARNLGRPEILALAAKVGYRAVNPGVAAASAPGRVQVEMGGRTERGEGDGRHSVGVAAIDEKFALNLGDSTAAAELAKTVRNLENMPNLDGLTARLRRAHQPATT